MNYKLNLYKGGGIFSLLVDVALPKLITLPDAENVYLQVEENQYNTMKDGFGFIFDQSDDESYQTLDVGFTRGFREPEKSPEFEKLRRAIRLFKPKLLSKKFTGKALGVHVRIYDMNKHHGQQ